MRIQIFFSLSFLLIIAFLQAQPDQDWYLQHPSSSGYNGIGVESAYQKFLNGKKSETVIVAVIDSGVDLQHEDLDEVIWTNPGELPENGKDDDGNGYIDDIHGWNFIGGADGKNVNKETLEMTRLYKVYLEKYDGVEKDKLSKKEKAEYEQFEKYGKIIKRKRDASKNKLDELTFTENLIINAIDQALKTTGDVHVNDSLVTALTTSTDEEVKMSGEIFKQLVAQEPSIKEVKLQSLKDVIHEDFRIAKEEAGTDYHFTYNPNYDSRQEIIKDNYADSNQRIYGNNDAEGEFAFHGTHVSGIIGAERNNDTGMNGIADNVRIMSIRTVPDGDERDKDVANAIRYAVDNGASVINMSFGKGQSWDKKVVDKAVKYAAKNDVLLVHAAGNSGALNDGTNNFPNAGFEKPGLFGKKRAKNWIEVGALNYEKGHNSIAGFSNYGSDQVDLFAPGVAIYSTAPNDSYQFAQGTSMASPVVAGTAALIRSYFPTLTARQVKEVIMQSTTPITDKVYKPGTFEKVSSKDLAISGGMLNAEKAIQLAKTIKGKKKQNNRKKEITRA